MAVKIELSAPAVGLYSIASLASIPLAYLDFEVPTDSLATLGIGVTATAAVTAWFVEFSRRRIALGPKLQLPIFFAQVVIVGAIRGWVFFELSRALQLPEPTPWLFRVVNSVLITLIWLTLACAVVTSHTVHQRTYRTLVNQAVFSRVNVSQNDAASLDDIGNILDLKANLSVIQERVIQAGASPDELIRAAALVREQIEATLRPLSHRLWFNATSGRPQTRVWGLVVDALAQLSYSIPLVLAICILPTFVGGLAFLAIGVNVLTVIISSATLLAILLLHSILRRRISRARTWINLLFVIGAGVLTYLVTFVSLATIISPDAADMFSSMAYVIPPAVWIVIWADSALILLNRDRATIASALSKSVASVQSTTRTINDEQLASYLHNSLQAELTGIAFQLEHAARSSDVDQSRQSLERLGALINRSMSQDFENFTELPHARLSRIVESWNGIAKVDVSIDPVFDESDDRFNIILQIIEEGIANAVRHGAASHVAVRIWKADESVFVQLTSAGDTLPDGPTGIGTAWINRYALQSHTSINNDGQRVLTVEL